jgi:hypothetical protein
MADRAGRTLATAGAGAMQRLVDRYIAYNRYAEAQAWATRILDLDPLDEAAHRQVMLLHARCGASGWRSNWRCDLCRINQQPYLFI